MIRHMRTVLAIVITVSTLVGTLAPTAAQRTRDETTFVSEVSGLTVDIGDSGFAQFNEEMHVIVPVDDGIDLERVVIDVGWSELNITFFSDNLVYPQSYNANTIQFHTTGQFREVEVLGEESNDEEGWLLTRRTVEWGTEQVHYNESYTDIGNGHAAVVTIFSHESTLIEHLQWVQENITIEGYPVLVDTDFPAISAMLDGTSSHVPWIASNDDASLFDWTAAGIQSKSEWNNNVHGHVVTWNPELWDFPFAYYNAIVENDEANSAEITLLNPHNLSSASIVFLEADEVRPAQEWEERWASPSWLSNTYPHREVLASTSDDEFAGVIYFQESKYGEPLIVTRLGVNMPGGIIAFAEIYSTPEMAMETYSDFIGGTFINGDPIGRLWAEEEFAAAIEHHTQDDASTPTGTGSDTSRGSRTNRTTRSEESVQVVTSRLTGAEVAFDTSTGAEFLDQGIVREGSTRVETVSIKMGTTYLDILFIADDETAPEDLIARSEESFADGTRYLERLGIDSGPVPMWAFYNSAHYLDFRDYYYLEFQPMAGDGNYLAVVVGASDSDIAPDVSWAQSNITVNGWPVLPAADIEHITSMVNGESDYVPVDITVQATTVEDWADQGLISDHAWISPLGDIEFEWDLELWGFSFNRADAIDISESRTILILETPDRRGTAKVRVIDENETPQSWVEFWASEEYRQREEETGFIFTVLDSHYDDTTGSVILLFKAELGEPVVLVRDIYIREDGATIMTEVFASPEDIARVYSDFWHGVQANGDYYPLTWSIEDIQALEIE